MKKLFLTSAITLCTICPAMAEHQTVNSFPADEYMLEDYTYQNQATYTNMGVYEGSVSATADYTDNVYTLLAGQYLPANSETPTTCDQNGYYCAGNSNGVNYQSYAQGLSQCPNDYSNTANGASSEDDCYRACTVQNANIEHASAVSGNDYYGNGTDTCTPTACDNGYHVQAGTPNLATIIGEATPISLAAKDGENFVEMDMATMEPSNNGISYYGLSNNEHNSWAIDFGTGKGIIRGGGICSTRQGEEFDIVSNLIDETGQEGAIYCYCQLDGYKVSGNAPLQNLSSSLILMPSNNSSPSDCTESCIGTCPYYISLSAELRSAMFGSIESGPASCAANTITITWADVDPTTAGQNNEGTATYGGDINTPVKAATKPGKTFVGWKFVKPAN